LKKLVTANKAKLSRCRGFLIDPADCCSAAKENLCW
jgi:hypothetical protein